jgi:hypothetical protein
MKYKTNSSKTIPLLIGTLTLSFLIVFLVYAAWTAPTSAPPAGNVDAPINVGLTNQLKSGKLGISTDGVDINYGLTVGNSTNLLGIKTNGDIQMGTTVIKGDGSISTNLNADKVDDLNAADLLAAAGGKVSYAPKCNAGVNTWSLGTCTPPSCAVGYSDLGTSCVPSGLDVGTYYWLTGYCERYCVSQ